jgi:hypothetical protein
MLFDAEENPLLSERRRLTFLLLADEAYLYKVVFVVVVDLGKPS